MALPTIAATAKGVARVGETAAIVKAAKPKSPRVKIRDQGNHQKPVVTTMTVVVGLEFLNVWIVNKEVFPDRKFWVRIAVLGFGLALLSDIQPKFGKTMAYLVMTAAIFDRSVKLLPELTGLEDPKPTPEEAAKNAAEANAKAQGKTLGGSVAASQSAPVMIYTGTGGAATPSTAQFTARQSSNDWPRPHRQADKQGPRINPLTPNDAGKV